MPKGPIIGALHDDPTVTILEQLKRDEGVRHTAYQDTHGVWTVGVGHNLRVPLSDTAIEQILADDLLLGERLHQFSAVDVTQLSAYGLAVEFVQVADWCMLTVQ